MKNRIRSSLVLSAWIALSALAGRAAGSVEDADWTLYLDVGRLKSTELYQCMREDPRGRDLEEMMAQIAEEAGVDPSTDMEDLFLYGYGREGAHALLCVTGRFDPEKVVSRLLKQESAKVLEYRKHKIHVWGREKTGMLVTSRLLLVSRDLDLLTDLVAEVDGFDGENLSCRLLFSGQETIPGSALLVAEARKLSRLMPGGSRGGAEAALLRKAKQARVVVEENGGTLSVKTRLTMASVQDAAQLVGMIQGGLFLANLRGGALPPALLSLAQSIHAKAGGDRVELVLSRPSRELVSILQKK